MLRTFDAIKGFKATRVVGKTESTKLMMRHILEICGQKKGNLLQKIIEVNSVGLMRNVAYFVAVRVDFGMSYLEIFHLASVLE